MSFMLFWIFLISILLKSILMESPLFTNSLFAISIVKSFVDLNDGKIFLYFFWRVGEGGKKRTFLICFRVSPLAPALNIAITAEILKGEKIKFCCFFVSSWYRLVLLETLITSFTFVLLLSSSSFLSMSSLSTKGKDGVKERKEELRLKPDYNNWGKALDLLSD